MRLIDADRLEYLLKLARVNPSNKDEGLKLARYYTKNMPTVEAIPVKWINNWLNTGRNAKYFIPMMEMIEQWEKENAEVTD